MNKVKNPRIKEYKMCGGCNTTKHRDEFNQYRYTTNQGKESRRLDSRCKECRKAERKKYFERPEVREHYRKASKQWRAKNAEHKKRQAKEYISRPEVKKMRADLQRQRGAAARAKIIDKEAVKNIYKQARALEDKLRACVDCDDDSELKIHVDHIIPVSMGGLTEPQNLQLLSAKENLQKHDRAYSVIGAPKYG